MRKSNVASFHKRIAETDWSAMYRFNHVDDCVDFFYETFSFAMSTIPVSFVKTTSNTKAWITPVLIDLINKRWQAFRSKNFILYAHFKRKVKYEIVKSKRIWSKKMLSTSKGVWSVVKHSTGKNDLSATNQLLMHFTNRHQAAEHVNSFFSNFFHNDVSCKLFSSPTCNDEIICNPVNVCDLLLKLKTNKALGSDQIPPYLLKYLLTISVNLCCLSIICRTILPVYLCCGKELISFPFRRPVLYKKTNLDQFRYCRMLAKF